MTGNHPVVRIDLTQSRAVSVAARPRELSAFEQVLFPAWLDHDQATGGPNYLGYSMLLMPLSLLVGLAVLAFGVVW